VGDRFITYFIQDPPRQRVFTVKGIYKTTLETFDQLYILADIQHIQKLNNWTNNQISGFEINVDDFKNLEYLTYKIRADIGTSISADGNLLRVSNIKEKYPHIFDWLNLQDINVVVILILVISVAIITMTSGVIILILEKTNFIGILKALGATNNIVKKIFIYQSGYLILKGLFWGNLIALAISYIQIKFQIIKLDPSTYYLETAPINISASHIILTNIATLAVITIAMMLPAIMISNIKPERTIRFD
jgi:lipoprotein-releasing system permease protein